MMDDERATGHREILTAIENFIKLKKNIWLDHRKSIGRVNECIDILRRTLSFTIEEDRKQSVNCIKHMTTRERPISDLMLKRFSRGSLLKNTNGNHIDKNKVSSDKWCTIFKKRHFG